MKWLENFSLVRINIISSILATIILLVIAGLLVIYEQSDRVSAQRNIAFLEVLKALDDVAHHHAVERGLTAGFLGNPSDESFAKVVAQRQRADETHSRLKSLTDNLSDRFSIIPRTTQLLFNELNGKSELRAAVDQRNGAAAFSYYSRLNRLALDAIASLSTELGAASFNEDLQMSIMLARFKERAGQVRGKVNGVLARSTITPALRSEIIDYQAEMALYASYLDNQMTGDRRDRVRAVLSDNTSQQISAVLSQLLASTPNFDQLPTSSDWFPLASAQIGNIKKLMDDEWLKISTHSQYERRSSAIKLWVTIILVAIAILLLVSINLAFTRVLRRSLQRLTEALKHISSERDLTRKIDLQGNNELTEIGRSVQQMLDTMEVTLKELVHSVNQSTAMASELDQSSDQLLGNAHETQQIASSISSAIEQNAATSSEIASAAATTLEAVQNITETNRENRQRFNKTTEVMQSLERSATNIEGLSKTLDQQVVEITNSVGIINSLFEQTNLLALNASIEAARAGEHGRGFAVVADEVRTLAMKSLQSSQRIEEVLKSLQKASGAINDSASENGALNHQASQVILEVQHSLESMNEVMGNLESMATSVATASEEQSAVSSVIAQDTAAVLDSSNSSLNLSQRLKQMSSDYRESGNHMLELARKFKL